MIIRKLQAEISSHLHAGKAIVVLGARQTGKTTLLQHVVKGMEGILWLNADEPDIIALFDGATSTMLKQVLGSNRIIVIDEAQRIVDVGMKMKLITDQIPDVQLILTGSSAFELANRINEPLTGRKWEYRLFPVSFSELVDHHGLLEETRLLKHRLVYGCYPEVVMNPGNERELLKQLSDSYLYKDLLMWEGIKKPEKILKLLQALAFQLGSEVSYNSLSSMVQLDNQTVEKYIQLLEQAYIIFRLPAFSRNLRKELKRGRKIYFYDNGIRNALLANYNQIDLRTDVGALWENYLISERMKYLHYSKTWANTYFWRTQDQQELDYIEEREGLLFAYEFKWNAGKLPRLSKTFKNAYPDHSYEVISPENYSRFIQNR